MITNKAYQLDLSDIDHSYSNQKYFLRKKSPRAYQKRVMIFEKLNCDPLMGIVVDKRKTKK